MIVLGLDTSSDAAAAGLVSDGRLLCEHTLHNGKNHSVNLLPMIEEMIRETGLSFEEIDGYACGVGPGSFTGVRIGVATAKGFAQAWNKPVIPISSLQALADNCSSFPGMRGAVVHARADEVYCAVYLPDGSAWLTSSVMTMDSLLDILKEQTNCMLAGSGALLYQNEIAEMLGEQVTLAPPPLHVIRGGTVAMSGYQLAEAGQMISYEQMAPVYLRASQAEREYKEK